MKVGQGYTHFINHAKVFIFVFWAFSLGIGVAVGPRFLSRTRDKLEAPADSAAAIANQLLSNTFPSLTQSSNFAVYVRSKFGNVSVFDEQLKQFSHSLNRSVYLYPHGQIQGFVGYYAFLEQGLPEELAREFVGPNNLSTILSISTSLIDQDAVVFAEFLQKSIEKMQPSDSAWEITLTGIPAFVETIFDNIERDFQLMDGIVLPIAIGLLALLLRSLRLLLLPLLCIATSSMVSLGLMYAITFVLDIASFAPSLMMSLLIAMSIDYSLFLLSRYREELHAGSSNYQAVSTSLATAGHTIIVSGTTLATCFLGLVLLPLNLMKSLGIGCSITLAITILVNLTLIPALLLLFPNFFSASVEPFSCFCCIFRYGSKKQQPDGNEDTTLWTPMNEDPNYEIDDYDMTSDGDHALGSSADDLKPSPKALRIRDKSGVSPGWYKFGKLMLKFPFNVVVILTVVSMSMIFYIHAVHYPTNASLEMVMPGHASITKTYQTMAADFGYGFLYPFTVLLIPKNISTNVISREFFDQTKYIIESLADGLPNTTVNDFSGLIYSNGQQNPYFLISGCIEKTIPKLYCGIIDWTAELFLNEHKNATFFYLRTRFNPLDAEAFAWYFRALELAHNLTEETGIGITFTGTGATTSDAIGAVNNSFGTMIGVTVAVVLVFVAVSFRSLLLPLRAVLTITLTILFVYGFADLVYVEGVFDWMHFLGLQYWGSIYWAPPIVSFSIIVGIGLDYDIFLLVRIKEFRDKGYSTPESILLGFSRTGHIITAAGVIMAIAFSGLLFSDIPGMTMLSFYMVFSVLFDTFVVRTLLVPSMMSLCGEANWWPGNVPPVTEVHDSSIGTDFAGGPCWCRPCLCSCSGCAGEGYVEEEEDTVNLLEVN